MIFLNYTMTYYMYEQFIHLSEEINKDLNLYHNKIVNKTLNLLIKLIINKDDNEFEIFSIII